MTIWQALRLAISVSAWFVGLVASVVGLYYLAEYWTDFDAPLRHEVNLLAHLWLFFGFAAFVLAAFLANSLDEILSVRVRGLLAGPTSISAVTIALLWVIQLVLSS